MASDSDMATAAPPSAPSLSAPATDGSAASAASAAIRTTPTLHLSEAVVGGLTVAVAVLAWAALGLAHLGLFSLPAVLVLAVAVLVVIALAIRWLAPVRVRVDRVGCVGVLVLGVLAALLFLPGFSYGVTDKDPGGYTEHAFSIARTGSFRIVDPTLDGRIPGGPVLEGPGARFGGLWLQRAGSDVIVPQFYHLWPALLAVAYDAGGERGLGQVAPLLGILAVLVTALALRRAVGSAGWVRSAGSARSPALAEGAGLLAGGIGGLLLVTNMLEVWQAKYPTTEISAQLLFLGALLGAIVALTTRWAPAAGAAGLLTTIGFLDRGDGLLPLLLAAVWAAALVATRRWDRRATWFAVGVAVVLPHALWQAYSPSAALHYSRDNNVPGLRLVALAVVVLAVLGVVLRPIGPAVAERLTWRRVQFGVGAVITALAGGLLLLGFLRPRLFGEDFFVYNGTRARSYDEQILARLSWFLTRPAFALLLLGIAVVALRRWSASLWVLTAPLLLIFPVYGIHARNSTRLMWWSRRYVPTVVPLVIMLVAVAITAIAVLLAVEVARRWPAAGHAVGAVRVVGALAALAITTALTVFYAGQSLPLRSDSEFGGGFALSSRIAAAAGGQQGVFLWQRSPACCLYGQSLFGGALWLERNQISAILPSDPSQVASYLAEFRRAFPGQPEFVIWHGQTPPQLPGVQLAPVDRITTALEYWEETFTTRPDTTTTVPVDLAVYRVAG